MKSTLGIERLVADRIRESVAVKQALLQNEEFLALVAEVARAIVESLRRCGTVFFFGNGGSAGDAQHLAAELVGRYLRERRGLAGLALTTNTSCLTAIANDYGYDSVFARQLQAMGSAGDIAIGISTSGNSANVLRAAEAAREKGMITVGMTGMDGGKLKSLVDYCLCVTADHTARIQEAHILIGHILCEIVEEELFDEGRVS
jgi:D-sedoheptulose 7-phosphate isomerase